jgi:hypothetical protein
LETFLHNVLQLHEHFLLLHDRSDAYLPFQETWTYIHRNIFHHLSPWTHGIHLTQPFETFCIRSDK